MFSEMRFLNGWIVDNHTFTSISLLQSSQSRWFMVEELKLAKQSILMGFRNLYVLRLSM